MRYLQYVLLTCCMLAVPAQAQIVFLNQSILTTAQQQVLNRVKTDIERILVFNAPVYIDVALDSSLMCSGGSAVLAQAGPTNIYRDMADLPETKTWYPASLAVQLSANAKKQQGSNASITAAFNSLTQAGCKLSWYYGSGQPSEYQTSFYDTVMHEIMHGLGFISLHSNTGQWYRGVNDVFSRRIGTGSGIYPVIWQIQPTSEQGAAKIQSDNVFWQGVKGQQFASLLLNAASRPKLYAPTRYEAGSSISHFDTSTQYKSGEDEMMEPYAGNTVLSHLSAAIFCDIGWRLKTDYDEDGIDDCSDTQPLLAQSIHDADPNEPDPDLPEGGDDNNLGNELSNCTYVLDRQPLDGDQAGIANICSQVVAIGSSRLAIPKSRLGAVLAAAGDMNGDGYGDYWLASPKADVKQNGKLLKAVGSVYLMSGKTNRPILNGVLTGKFANGYFGSQIVSNVDFDGDGCPDTFFSSPNETITSDVDGKIKKLKAAGAVYQFSPFEREGNYCIWRDTMPQRIHSGSQAQAKAGSALLFVDDDINEPMLLIGEPGYSNQVGEKRVGAVFGLSKSWKEIFFQGRSTGELFGSQLALGRYDGLQSLVAVGAPGIRQGKRRGGIYWVDLNGQLNVNKLQPTLLPENLKNCVLNGPLSTLRLANGDILAAASPHCRLYQSRQGAVWLFDRDTSINVLAWPQSGLGLGNSLAAADVSGDGIDDLIIGSAQGYFDRSYPKPPANSGSIIIYDPTKKASFLNGHAKNEQFGCAMTTGFIDRDQRADVIVASCGVGKTRESQLGFVKIILGR